MTSVRYAGRPRPGVRVRTGRPNVVPEVVEIMCRLRREGNTMASIAEATGYCVKTIRNHLRGKRR